MFRTPRQIAVLAVMLAIATVTHPVIAADLADIARSERLAIEAESPIETIAMLQDAVSSQPGAEASEGFGHMYLMNRHLNEASWSFANAVEQDSDRASALTALGVGMLERSYGTDRMSNASHLKDIVVLQRAAAERLPNEASIQNNLGTALLRLAEANDNDRDLLTEAIDTLRRAAETAAPPSALYYSRLAEALAVAGDMDGASDALEQAFALNPVNFTLAELRNSTSGAAIPVTPDQTVCNINYDCMNTCPQGIIGRIKVVSCEIEQSSAVLACMDGTPYASSYDCDIEFPRFGIMIPGLYPGFSILTPWGSIDIIVQGGGRVEYRVKVNSPSLGNMQAFATAQGEYNPHTGENRWDLGGGFQYNLGNSNTAMNKLNEYDVGVSGVIGTGPAGETPEIRLEGARGVLLTH